MNKILIPSLVVLLIVSISLVASPSKNNILPQRRSTSQRVDANKLYGCQISFGHFLVVQGNEEPSVSVLGSASIGCRCFTNIITKNGQIIVAITEGVGIGFCVPGAREDDMVEDKDSVLSIVEGIKACMSQ